VALNAISVDEPHSDSRVPVKGSRYGTPGWKPVEATPSTCSLAAAAGEVDDIARAYL
jgi:hypothetical protein